MTSGLGADEKICPMCAETVKSAAVRCRFCNYDFTGRSQIIAAAPTKDDRPGIAVGWVLAGLGAFLLISYCSSDLSEAPAPASPPKSEALGMMEIRSVALKVTPAELYQAYDANEAAAQARYGGRLLEVTGTVAGVDLDLTDDPIVELDTGQRYDEAQLSLIDAEKYKAAGLTKGQKIVFLCQKVREVIGTPILEGCIIADRL